MICSFALHVNRDIVIAGSHLGLLLDTGAPIMTSSGVDFFFSVLVIYGRQPQCLQLTLPRCTAKLYYTRLAQMLACKAAVRAIDVCYRIALRDCKAL